MFSQTPSTTTKVYSFSDSEPSQAEMKVNHHKKHSTFYSFLLTLNLSQTKTPDLNKYFSL